MGFKCCNSPKRNGHRQSSAPFGCVGHLVCRCAVLACGHTEIGEADWESPGGTGCNDVCFTIRISCIPHGVDSSSWRYQFVSHQPWLVMADLHVAFATVVTLARMCGKRLVVLLQGSLHQLDQSTKP